MAGEGALGAAVRLACSDPAMNAAMCEHALSIADLYGRLQALGDREGARFLYWESLYQEPLRWEIHNNLAMVERELGHYDDARRLLRLSIRVNSQCEHCFVNLVGVYTAQGAQTTDNAMQPRPFCSAFPGRGHEREIIDTYLLWAVKMRHSSTPMTSLSNYVWSLALYKLAIAAHEEAGRRGASTWEFHMEHGELLRTVDRHIEALSAYDRCVDCASNLCVEITRPARACASTHRVVLRVVCCGLRAACSPLRRCGSASDRRSAAIAQE